MEVNGFLVGEDHFFHAVNIRASDKPAGFKQQLVIQISYKRLPGKQQNSINVSISPWTKCAGKWGPNLINDKTIALDLKLEKI
jgi:hypothetical protein